MKFALVGDHLDGLDFARALAANGRHELAVYSGSQLGSESLQRAGLTPRRAGDLEEVLADPSIEGVIVAGSKSARGQMLRRAVQSERHVLSVHPADPKPDLAFETAMIQADTGYIVLPLLPEAFHPGVARFAQLMRERNAGVIEVRRSSCDDFWLDFEGDDARPGLPGWDVLRRIGGEVAELYGLAAEEEPSRGRPLVVAGKFVDGRLFHATYLANQAENFWRIAVVGGRPLALVFAQGWPGPATLTHEDDTGALRTESWPALPPWSPLIDALDAAILARRTRRADQPPGETDNRSWTSASTDNATTSAIQAAETFVGTLRQDTGPTLGWTDEIVVVAFSRKSVSVCSRRLRAIIIPCRRVSILKFRKRGCVKFAPSDEKYVALLVLEIVPELT